MAYSSYLFCNSSRAKGKYRRSGVKTSDDTSRTGTLCFESSSIVCRSARSASRSRSNSRNLFVDTHANADNNSNEHGPSTHQTFPRCFGARELPALLFDDAQEGISVSLSGSLQSRIAQETESLFSCILGALEPRHSSRSPLTSCQTAVAPPRDRSSHSKFELSPTACVTSSTSAGDDRLPLAPPAPDRRLLPKAEPITVDTRLP